MAFKGNKRAASKVAGAKKTGGVAKKCRTIAATIRGADGVPAPVRSMLCDTLVRTFSTYKEERHPLQATVVDNVGKVLKGAQAKLQAGINEANQKKAAAEGEASPASQANNAAVAASEAASTASADSKTAKDDSKTALKDAKTALHDFESAVKDADAHEKTTAAKKENLEACGKDYINAVREGTRHGAAVGKHVAKEVRDSVESEFLECVTRTFSKASAAWGTFDGIIDKKLQDTVNNTIAGLAAELGAAAAAKAAQVTNVENAKGAVTAAEEKVKAMDEACTAATAAANEAQAAAKTTGAAYKGHAHAIQKAADACAHALDAMSTFEKGALAAYTEIEARVAPPPAPEKPAEAAALVDTAMTPAPPPAARTAPTVAPSPGLLSRAASAVRGLPSPRVASGFGAQ